VYTRFDSDIVNPLELAHCFGRTLESEEPMPMDLELYNNSGNRFLGIHYEPVLGSEGPALPAAPPPPNPFVGDDSKEWKSRRRITKKRRVDLPHTSGQGIEHQSWRPDDSTDGVARASHHGNNAVAEGVSGATHYILRCHPSPPEEDERNVIEVELEKLADKMSSTPTVPEEHYAKTLREDIAVQLPLKHCAFSGCKWNYSDSEISSSGRGNKAFMDGADRKLVDHLLAAHSEALEPVAGRLAYFSGPV